MLHPRAQGRRAADRPGSRGAGRARATRSSAHAARSSAPNCLQVKGFPYTLQDLLGDPELVNAHRNGRYVTLRLTSSMYHRFHAPHDCRVEQVTYISGDTWNVNPIALKRIEKLFCKNERALLQHQAARDRPHRDAGAGRRGAGRQHPAAFPRCPARSQAPRAQRHRLRCAVPKGRGDGLVRARIDDHRASRRMASRCAKTSGRGPSFAWDSR